jgi:4-amino-4-deoxy-L-arabinose transferase-like glycosyltransferase
MKNLNRSEIYILVILVLWGTVLRAFYLDQPMRFDESATFLSYINNDWLSLFNYTAPNNHVLNSLLGKITTSLWGSHPAIIRLPAFIFGIGSIILIFIVCRALGSSGWLAVVIMVCHPYLILFSTNARGYSGLVFFTLLFLFQAIQVIDSNSRARTLMLALVGAVGLLNMPIMLFPICGIVLWLLLRLFSSKQSISTIFTSFLVPFSIILIGITLLLYAPVIISTTVLNGGVKQAIQMLVNNEFVAAIDSTFFLSTIQSYGRNLIRVYLQSIPVALLFFGFLLTLLGCIREQKSGRHNTMQLLLVLVCVTLVLFIAKHTFPYPRTWIFFIPVFALVADSGFSFILTRLKSYASFAVLALPLSVLLLTPTLLQRDRFENDADTGVFSDAGPIAKHMHSFLRPNDSVLAPIIPSNLPLYFYLWYAKNYHPNKLEPALIGSTYVFIPSPQITLEMYSHSPHPIDTSYASVADGNAVKVFEFNGSALYKLKE